MLKKYFGPSTLIAAAFIGPGTITTCSMAGVELGYALIWALIFSIIATIILQEMAARLGIITQAGLGESIRTNFKSAATKYLAIFLVIGAILIGNAAYEAGNISGGLLGLELLIGPSKWWPLLIGLGAFILLFIGKYKWIENLLIALVLLMSVCFLISAILVKPDINAIISGLVPANINRDYLLIMGLIGTTVVPYNLFLHASTISKKYGPDASLKDLRIENRVSIILGGIISILIVITAAGSQDQISSISNAKDLAIQMEPLFGTQAKILMGIGLFAAGLSSALTAPLAASYAAQGLFGLEKEEKKWGFRSVWMIILVIGILVSSFQLKPVEIIKFAQIMNAILLPLIAIYLVILCNNQNILGRHKNSLLQNLMAAFVLIITLLLSYKTLNFIIQQL